MKVTKEISLNDFEWWGGAKDKWQYLKYLDTEILEECITEMFPDGIDETSLNDLVWFEEDYLANFLGFDDFDEVIDFVKKRYMK